MTPDQCLRSMVKNQVQPHLKARGFSKRSLEFRRQTNEVLQLISFQKSIKSSSSQVLVTVNIGIASLRLLPVDDRASETTKVWDCHWRQRIGHLSPRREDVWWPISDMHTAELAGRELNEWMVSWVMPELDRLTDDMSLCTLWLSDRSPGLTDFQRMLYLSYFHGCLGSPDVDAAILGELVKGTKDRPHPELLERLRALQP